MKKYQNQLIILWRVFLSALLVIFMLLSLNSVLPLKWRFPQWRLSPHLGKLTEETADSTRTHYVNGKNDITVALDKNYSTITKTFDQDGNCILEQYFDNHRKPAVTVDGYHALQRVYNEEGQWVLTTYLNDRLNPAVSNLGYASVRRTWSCSI